jgi:hypothetical protein
VQPDASPQKLNSTVTEREDGWQQDKLGVHQTETRKSFMSVRTIRPDKEKKLQKRLTVN